MTDYNFSVITNRTTLLIHSESSQYHESSYCILIHGSNDVIFLDPISRLSVITKPICSVGIRWLVIARFKASLGIFTAGIGTHYTDADRDHAPQKENDYKRSE